MRICVVRALGGLGDWLCAVPAMTRLREVYSQAQITLIGMAQTQSLIARYPHLVDRFLAFPGFPGVIEAEFVPARLDAFLRDRRAEPAFDLVLQMHGSGNVTNPFAALLGGRRTIGFHLPGLWRPDSEVSCPWPFGLPEQARLLALLDAAGIGKGAPPLDFPVSPAEQAGADALVREIGGVFAIVHAGASQADRRWPPERFARIGDLLARLGLTVVLTGTADEAPITGAVAAAMRGDAIDLTGCTALGVTAGLLRRAALTVSNDTGVSHLAAAVRAASVVVFSQSDPARWAPVDAALHRAVGGGAPEPRQGEEPAPCVPDYPPVEAVVAAVEAQLELAA